MLSDYFCVEKCRGCGQLVQPERAGPVCVCRSCWQDEVNCGPFLESLFLDCKVGEGRPFIPVASGTAYSGILKKLVYRLKYDKDKVVVHDLAPLACRAFQILIEKELPPGASPLLVPIPLHWTRLFTRGYNQAELIADEVAQKFKLKVDVRLLARRRATTAQHDLGKQQRRENIMHAFRVGRWAQQHPAPLVLVDDIYTSGATLAEAAMTLRAHGFRHIFAITAARALLAEADVLT